MNPTKNKTPCRWKKCTADATKLISGVPLCEEHLGEAKALLDRLPWTKFLRAFATKVTGESSRDLDMQADGFDDVKRAAPDVVKTRGEPGGAA
jgi:hypothetical protein